jgi:hypothetical protein
MRFTHTFSLAALTAGVIAQAIFEPQDFDPAAALQDLGVNVSVLPEPNNSTLTARSPFSPCALAVGLDHRAVLFKL